jgi:hypothetical protein
VQDQPVVRIQPEGLRNNPIKLELDAKRVLAGGKAGAVAHPEDVRVDGEGLLVEGGVENDVGRLPPDSRQLLQLFACARHLAAMVADERFGQGDDVLGLGVEQADGLDGVADPILAERDHLLRRLDVFEQGAGCDVHACVGRLGRQDDGHEQGVGIVVFQLGCRGGVVLRKPAEELENLILLHKASTTSRIV